MSAELWRDRLRQKIQEDGRAASAISEAAGLGPNTVASLLKGGSNNGIETLFRVCEEISVDPAYLFTGLELSPALEAFLGSPMSKDEELLRALLRQLSPETPT